MASNELRERKAAPPAEPTSPPPTKSTSRKPAGHVASDGIGVLDILRVLGGLFILNAALSWFVTGNSFTWGWRPWYVRPEEIGRWWRGPVQLTDSQLLEYDGTDPKKPIYLAINGSIYDVSAGRGFYAPGGSYHFFAGRDATRAFITGCFAEDLTPDLRGVEDMFIPVDPPLDSNMPKVDPHTADVDDVPTAALPKSLQKVRREREMRAARTRIRSTIDGWEKTFSGTTGKPYFWVGKMKRPEGWLEALPKRKLCKKAEESRPVRGKRASS